MLNERITKCFKIRKGQIDDLDELQMLFIETVTEVCISDYADDQIDAWVSDTKNNVNKQRWVDALSNQFVLVAQDENKIIGFATLDCGNYIDFLFVHKDFQRQGVANKLYKEIGNEALHQQSAYLTSNVSKTARPFFENNGFVVVKEQVVHIKGVKLTNYKMMKTIGKT